MKKYLFAMCSLALSLVLISSCSNDDDNDNASSQSTKYLKVENATYDGGSFPTATTKKKLGGVSVDSQGRAGGLGSIHITSDRPFKRFFIGVKNVPGYWIYTPNNTKADDTEEGDYYYDIPFNFGGDTSGDFTIQVSGEDENGTTEPYEQEINIVDGASVKLKSVKSSGMDFLNITYNEQGKVASYIVYPDENMRFSYNGSIISSAYDPLDEIEFSVTQNDKGYITRLVGTDSEGYSVDAHFSYDNDGHLTKYSMSDNDGGGTTYKWIWSGGCVIRAEFDDMTASFTYGNENYVNVTLQPFITNTYTDGFPIGTNLFGRGMSRLPNKVTYTGGRYNGIYDISYTFNTNGSIDTQTFSQDGVQRGFFTYSY